MFTRHHKGFLLTEVLLGVVITSIVVILFGRNIMSIFSGWRKMQIDGELLDAGRYMLTKIERHLGLEATGVRVINNSTIDFSTEYPDKTIKLYIHSVNGGLYMQTISREGTGVNPLYIRDCAVSNWRAERISNKEILVSFTLKKDNRTKDFVRLFYCVNGTVQNGS